MGEVNIVAPMPTPVYSIFNTVYIIITIGHNVKIPY